MKKNDLILFFTIIVISLAAIFILKKTGISESVHLDIYRDNSLYGSYELNVDREIDIDGKNICVIEDGKVYMKDADCPDKLCVHSRAISNSGESIICIPNRVTLIISGGSEDSDDGGYDTVVK